MQLISFSYEWLSTRPVLKTRLKVIRKWPARKASYIKENSKRFLAQPLFRPLLPTGIFGKYLNPIPKRAATPKH